jgi:hypothetical protein
VERTPVESKALRSLGYDDATCCLELEFSSGAVYRYLEVPRSVYDWLLRASNKGVFVARQITGRYTFESVPERPPTPPEGLEAALRASLERPEQA